MSKFGGFFARRAGLYDKPADPTPSATPQTDNPLELDEELFTALGAQLGGENESLRNLLLDANAKIGELDGIKNAVGKLVDPVSKALRAFEAEKSEKISLQTVLNNTRTAYGKLRNEVAELEKKANLSEKECQALRQELTTTQNLLRTLEATKAEIAIDIAARRAQIVDLETRLAQETGEGKALREENRRLDERLSTADKRVMALESELNGARQRLLMLEDEKRAQQISLDKISAESARVSRKLAETEASLTATQGRLRHVDGTVAELNTERARLTARSMRRTSATNTKSQPSACVSTLCRHAPPRVKNCSARRASTCWREPTRSEPMIVVPANLRLNAMPCRHAWPTSRPSACSGNPNSRRSTRPARPSSNAAPRSPALSRQKKRR